MRPIMMVTETRNAVTVDWATRPHEAKPRAGWRKKAWAHSDCDIWYKRLEKTPGMNYERVANAIMNALLEAGMPIGALSYQLNTPCIKRAVSPGQKRLL